MNITTRDKTVGDLLKEFLFIPRFQRPYDWEKDQVEQFWMDTLVDNPDDYFIGGVVLYKQDDAFGVVDGQQRITTLLMMLCAIRDAFADQKLQPLADAIQATIEKVDIDNKKRFVLLTETSFPYLQDIILSSDPAELDHELGPEERALEATYELIVSKVNDALTAPTQTRRRKNRAEAVLKGIRDRLLGLKLITVYLDNSDDAYLIFETLNTRGKDLEVSHLLKNHLSRLLKPKTKSYDPLKLKWEKILETFEASQADIHVDAFLHHYWLSTRERYVTAKKLFADMKRDIVTQDQAQEEVDALIADAKLYRAIVEPAFGKWTKEERKIRNYLDALADFRVRQPFPLVLSIMRAYREKGITKKNAEAMLWAIVKFHFTFTAISSKSSSGGLSMMYAAWARALYAAKTEPQRQGAIRQVVNGLAARRPPESDFVAGFKALRYSDDFTKQKKLVRYVLKNIADHVASAGIAADHEQMTIEHIASQNPSSPTAVSDAHVAMMGNLLWCDQHVQHLLKNKSFAEKKEVLKKKSVPGAPDVFRRARWGEREIEARTEDLAKIAYNEIWK